MGPRSGGFTTEAPQSLSKKQRVDALPGALAEQDNWDARHHKPGAHRPLTPPDQDNACSNRASRCLPSHVTPACVVLFSTDFDRFRALRRPFHRRVCLIGPPLSCGRRLHCRTRAGVVCLLLYSHRLPPQPSLLPALGAWPTVRTMMSSYVTCGPRLWSPFSPNWRLRSLAFPLLWLPTSGRTPSLSTCGIFTGSLQAGLPFPWEVDPSPGSTFVSAHRAPPPR